MTRLSVIAIVAANGVIGIDNHLPWHLPEDLAYFKRTTSGHSVIMGRKTFESIGRPLPSRRNLVVTRTAGWAAIGVEAVASLREALERCAGEAEIFVIGGQALFREALTVADRLYITRLDRNYEGDAHFPEIPTIFREVGRESHRAAADHELQFHFVTYERA